MYGKSKLASALSLAGLLAVAGPAAAEDAHHGHEGHGKGDHGKLTLNDGKKWTTDASLRKGMVAIRDHLQAALDPIHAKTYTPEQYAALAGKIDAEVSTIVSTCKLPPEVDAQLHLVIAELYAGSHTMKGNGDRMSGAVTIIRALGAYEKHFEHPGWKPIVH